MTSSASESSSTLSSGTTSRSLSISVPAAYPLLERRRFIGARLPEGLAAAVEALAREVLRERPDDIYSFAAQHFRYLVESRMAEWSDQAQRQKAAGSESTRRFCSVGENRPIGGRSVVSRSKPPKKKCSRINDAAGWSISETSRILKKQAVFGSRVAQSQIEEDAQHSSEDSKIPRASCQSGTIDLSSSLSETGERNTPPVIDQDSGVKESTNFKDVENQIQPRRGSFELIELLDTEYPRKPATAPLLRSISFDCILPRRIDQQFKSCDETDPTRSIIATAARSNSATSRVPSLRSTKTLKDNTNKHKPGSVFLPAVNSSRWLAASPPAPSFTSALSSASSASSSSLPAADSSSDHQSESGRVRGNNGSTTLPLLKYDSVNKSAKKCNYALVLPAVPCGTSSGAVGPAFSEGQSAFAAVEEPEVDAAGRLPCNPEEISLEERNEIEGTVDTDDEQSTTFTTRKQETTRRKEKAGAAAAISNTIDEDERLRMNELGKKLLALETVERKIERRLALGCGAPEKLAFTRNHPMEKNEEQKNSIKGDWQLHDDMNKQESGGARHSLFSDALFGDRLNADSVDGADSPQQEGTIGTDSGGSADPHRIPLSIGNNIIVPAGRVELEEIMEEAEDESVVVADDESRVVKSILAENLDRRDSFGNVMPLGSSANPPEENANPEKEKKVLENGEEHNSLANDGSAHLEEKCNGMENPSNRSNSGERIGDLTMVEPVLEATLTSSASLIEQGDIAFEEEIAKELIENGKSESLTTLLREPSLSRQSTDTEGEKTPMADSLDDASSLLRVCHTGEFHDSLPLHFFTEIASSSLMIADTDNMLRMEMHEEHDATNTIVSSESAATREPAAPLAPSNSEEPFDIGQVVSVAQSSKVPLSAEQAPFPLSGTFSFNDFLSATTQLMHPISVGAIPQDQLSLCTVIRGVPTNFESFIPFTPNPYSYLYISHLDLAIPADAHNILQDSTGGDASTSDTTSLTIEEIPNANDTPQDQVQEMEIKPAIDVVVASIPSSTADEFSSEEFHHLEEKASHLNQSK